MNESGEIIGVAKTRLNQQEIIKQQHIKNSIAAHADDIVIF
jgi:hypothetical protein